MTRKDYVLLADALHSAKPDADLEALTTQWARSVRAVCNALERENARFDRDRFLKACGIDR